MACTQQDAELLEATASEPLSLKEEYEMQQTWLHDEQSMEGVAATSNATHRPRDRVHVYLARPNNTRHARHGGTRGRCATAYDDASFWWCRRSTSTGMCGDVNLFLGTDEDDLPTAEVSVRGGHDSLS